MKPLPCGCVPCARWCGLATVLQETLDAAVSDRADATTPSELDKAARVFALAQHELRDHLRITTVLKEAA